MVTVSKENYISQGLHRKVYFHPEDNDKCIKVLFHPDGTKEMAREKSYFAHLNRRNISWSHMPRYHGVVETNDGEGLVYDLIRDHTGEVSDTLEHCFEDVEKTAKYADVIRAALAELKQYLLQNGVVTMTIKPKNILLQFTSDTQAKLVVVDNVGTSDFIPICLYLRPLARRKTTRKWQRFIKASISEYPNNPHIARLFE